MQAEFDAARLAIAYKRLVLWFGAQLVLGIVTIPLMLPGGRQADSGPLASLLTLATWLIALVLIYYAYRTAQALGSTVPWVWAAALAVPLINIVSLLILSARATRACRRHGVPVGFLGPKIEPEPERPRFEP